MNFMEAVKARCQGKCIVSFDDKYKLEGTGSNIEIYDLELCDFKKLNKYIVELDWKVFEKEKTLSDCIKEGVMADFINRDDVESFIKKIKIKVAKAFNLGVIETKGESMVVPLDDKQVIDIIDKSVGERLIKD